MFDLLLAATVMAAWAGLVLLLILIGKTAIDYTAERIWGRVDKNKRERGRGC